MQRLVRVRRGVLDHDRATVGCTAAVAGRTEDFVQPFGPEAGRERNVQEAFDHVVAADFRYRADQSTADLLGRSLGTLAAELEQREDDEGHVALELLAGLLYLDRGAAGVAVKRLDAAGNVLLDELLDVHGWSYGDMFCIWFAVFGANVSNIFYIFSAKSRRGGRLQTLPAARGSCLSASTVRTVPRYGRSCPESVRVGKSSRIPFGYGPRSVSFRAGMRRERIFFVLLRR